MSDAPVQAPVTQARMMAVVFPDHTNHIGTLFGGQALAWMDSAAFIAASRFSRRTVVTARSEQIDFNQPVHKGDLVEVIATVIEVGRSSMTVQVDLFKEDLLSGQRVACTRGRFVMIALNAEGRPTRVPALPAAG